METVNENTEQPKTLLSSAKKVSFCENILILFSKYKLIFILTALFLLLIIFYGVSKYIRQEIIKNMTFSMPKIDVSQDNDKNGKKNSDTKMLDEVKRSVDEDKTASGGEPSGVTPSSGEPLKVQDKGLINYGMGNVFNENPPGPNPNKLTETQVQNPPLATHIIEAVSAPKVKKGGYGGRKRAEKLRETVKVVNVENPFNTIVLENPIPKVSNGQNRKKELVKAAIYGTQVVHNNSSVRIRLLEAMTIDDNVIPANTLCSGVAMMGGNRLIIMITAIKSGTDFIPTKMIVYDSNDMLPGIAFLSDNTKGQIKQQNNQAIDNIDNAVYNIGSAAGLAGQVGAGVVSGISRSLRYGGVQKKAGEIELNEGYKVFLKQN